MQEKNLRILKEEAISLYNPEGQLGIRNLSDGSQQLYFIESVFIKREGKIANIIPLTRIVTDGDGYILAQESYLKTLEIERGEKEVVDTRKRETIDLADVDILVDQGKSSGWIGN